MKDDAFRRYKFEINQDFTYNELKAGYITANSDVFYTYKGKKNSNSKKKATKFLYLLQKKIKTMFYHLKIVQNFQAIKKILTKYICLQLNHLILVINQSIVSLKHELN